MRFPRNPKRQTVNSKTDDIVRHLPKGKNTDMDEIQVAAKTQEIADKIVELAQTAMRNVGDHFNFRCQLDTEGKTGANWKDCH